MDLVITGYAFDMPCLASSEMKICFEKYSKLKVVPKSEKIYNTLHNISKFTIL
jgi:hypothetical protein